MKYIYFLLLFILFTTNFAWAQTATETTEKAIPVGKQLYFLEDSSSSLTIDAILRPENQARFKMNMTDVANFGNSASTFWLKLELDTRQMPTAYLEIGNPMLDEVSLFSFENGIFKERKAGASLPKSVQEVDANSILFGLAPQPDSVQSQTYYLKVHSNYPLEIPVSMGSLRVLMERQAAQNVAFSLYMGLMLSMALYNLIIFFFIRDRAYLIYSSFSFFIGLFYLHLKGYMFHLLWSEVPNLNDYTPLYSSVVTILMLLFANEFLKASKYTPILYKISFVFYAVFLICIVLNLSGDYHISASVSQLGAMFLSIYILVMAIAAMRAGSPMARFYLVAWSIYLVSVVILILQVVSVIESNVFTGHSVFIGTALEVLLLSLALAYRINVLRAEKEQAQAKNLHLIKEQNKVLEETVAEKTKDLRDKNELIQSAYEEVTQVNEELQQTQEELMAQRDLLADQNIKLEHFRTKITSSIRSAYTIQQAILPPKAKLDETLHNYFIINRPKDYVSGDFYWVNQIDNKKFVIVADCTGHGVSGAFMTMIGNTLLDKIIKEWHIHNPAQILTRLHQEIQAVLQQDETGNTDGMDVAIAVLEELTQTSTRLLFAGAKRPMYYAEAESSLVQKLSGVRRAIGGRANDDKNYQCEDLLLNKGAIIYLASDGFVDQNNADRKSFSEPQLLKTLTGVHHKPLQDQKSYLEFALDAHMTDVEQRDDILLLGMRV